jgi:hypothetical protein
MKKSALSLFAGSMLLASAGLASAQTTTTTTTWTNDQGAAITAYSTTQKYMSFNDPALKPAVGMALPSSVAIYPLPGTVTVTTPERYSYGIVNGHNVVVDRSTRQVVHTWN